MSEEDKSSFCCSEKCCSVLGYVAAVVVAIGIVAGLNVMLRSYTQPVEQANRGSKGVERKAERIKLNNEAVQAANAYGDPDPNLIQRVPLERGMQLIISEYQNGENSRAILNARVTKSLQKASFE
ncbi:MAG: hypothetical protein ACKVHO_14750 [Verrucomicrobiia bacterium]|jgi:hypothetical protein